MHSARLLLGMVQKLRPSWNIACQLGSVQDSIEWFSTHPAPDLVFMDIQLNDGICFDIFEAVKLSSKIIFTTAYDQYAIQAFDVNSIDYLLKPVKESKLASAIEKFETLFPPRENRNQPEVDYSALLSALKAGQNLYKARFLVSGATSLRYIKTGDIAYFYTQNRVSYAVDFHGREHVVEMTLEKIETHLDPAQFFRASRSHILNIDAIHSAETFFGGKYTVKLIHPFKEQVTVSRLKATEFKAWLNG